MAERTAAPETVSLVETDRRRLVDPGFEPQYRFSRVARCLLDAGEDRLPDAASARRLAGVHALHFGIAVEQGERAAPDRRATQTRDKKPDGGLEHLLDREAVPLMRLIEGAEHLVEFGDQFPRILCRTGEVFDADV